MQFLRPDLAQTRGRPVQQGGGYRWGGLGRLAGGERGGIARGLCVFIYLSAHGVAEPSVTDREWMVITLQLFILGPFRVYSTVSLELLQKSISSHRLSLGLQSISSTSEA